MSRKVCVIAGPLIARSGVYNSTIELVTRARSEGREWTAFVGVSAAAGGSPAIADGVHEVTVEPRGMSGIARLCRTLQSLPQVRDADLVISMTPQTDMALSLTCRPWVAYLRGLPWPAAGEGNAQRARAWQALERLALRRAHEVWSTTRLLAEDVGGLADRIVPPGLLPPAELPRVTSATDFVWAARFSTDKNPALFLRALEGASRARGVMNGTGPLEESVRAAAPANVEVHGWTTREQLWQAARAYVGTSTREAFGRSAVEAAMLGIPVIVSDQFGCAEMLYTDPALRARFVLPVGEDAAWSSAIESLRTDDALHAQAAAHVRANAANLTVDATVRNVAAAVDRVLAS